MTCTNLILDFSEEFITLCCKGITFISETNTEHFWADSEGAIKKFKEELASKTFDCSDLIISLPISCINYQIVTLPDNVTDKEKQVFLGLEIDPKLIGNRFGIQRLDVTQRLEGEQPLCDYLVISPKADVYKKLEELAKALQQKILSVIPSFTLLIAERKNELRATAWVGEDRSEIVIWGMDNPLAIACLPNTGDQIGDINRFIVEYFDHVDNLTLSMVYLYGPRMKDTGLGFGLTYPHIVFDDPVRLLSRNLEKAPECLNIAKITKLPKPPIPMTPRNLTFIGSALAIAVLLFFAGLSHANVLRLKSEITLLEKKSRKLERITQDFKKLEKQMVELNAEKEFYLDITKRRTPWQKILAEISRLTPKEMWFERLNASKTKLLILGKARDTDDVSSFSINLNNSSEYIQEALVLGTRDSEDDNNLTFSEFQISAKLKAPSGKFEEQVN